MSLWHPLWRAIVQVEAKTHWHFHVSSSLGNSTLTRIQRYTYIYTHTHKWEMRKTSKHERRCPHIHSIKLHAHIRKCCTSYSSMASLVQCLPLPTPATLSFLPNHATWLLIHNTLNSSIHREAYTLVLSPSCVRSIASPLKSAWQRTATCGWD